MEDENDAARRGRPDFDGSGRLRVIEMWAGGEVRYAARTAADSPSTVEN